MLERGIENFISVYKKTLPPPPFKPFSIDGSVVGVHTESNKYLPHLYDARNDKIP